MRILIIAASLLLTLPLAGCVTGGGDLVVAKPSRSQLQSSVSSTVCNSFKIIKFSGPSDTPATVKQVREHNAALRSFGCK